MGSLTSDSVRCVFTACHVLSICQLSLFSRMKKDVLSQLPSKCRTVVMLDPSFVTIDQTMSESHRLVYRMKVKNGVLVMSIC